MRGIKFVAFRQFCMYDNRGTKICQEQIITQDGDDDVGDDEDDDDEDGYYSISMRMLLDYIRSQL